ncbi:hypothetical protein BDV06DRAFT_196865 [Aspergillus oleicola]
MAIVCTPSQSSSSRSSSSPSLLHRVSIVSRTDIDLITRIFQKPSSSNRSSTHRAVQALPKTKDPRQRAVISNLSSFVTAHWLCGSCVILLYLVQHRSSSPTVLSVYLISSHSSFYSTSPHPQHHHSSHQHHLYYHTYHFYDLTLLIPKHLHHSYLPYSLTMAPMRPNLPPLSTPKNMTFPSELRDPPTYTCLDSSKDTKDPKFSPESARSITPPSAYTEFLNTFSPIFTSPKSSRANFSKYMLDQPRPSPTSAPASAVTFPSSRLSERSRGHVQGNNHRRSNSNGSNNGHISNYGNYRQTSTLPVPSPRCFKNQSADKSPIRSQTQHQNHTAPRHLRLPPSQGYAQLGHGSLYTPTTASPLSGTSCPQHHHHRPSPSEWRFHQLDTPASATDGGSFSMRQVTTTTVTFRVAPRLAAPPTGKRKRAGVGKKCT